MSISKRQSLSNRRKISGRQYAKTKRFEDDIHHKLAEIREQPEAYIHSYRQRLFQGVLYSTDEADATAHRMLLVLKAAQVEGTPYFLNYYLSYVEEALPILVETGRHRDAELLIQSVKELALSDDAQILSRYFDQLRDESRFQIQETLENLVSIASRLF